MPDPRPLYQQLAAGIRDQIGDGSLAEGDRAPSTNELSAFHSVNPTTSAKALTMLFDEGLLEKRRGLGMFVLPGAREQVRSTRRRTDPPDRPRKHCRAGRNLPARQCGVDKLDLGARRARDVGEDSERRHQQGGAESGDQASHDRRRRVPGRDDPEDAAGRDEGAEDEVDECTHDAWSTFC